MLARMRQYADVVRDVREVDAAGGPRHQVCQGAHPDHTPLFISSHSGVQHFLSPSQSPPATHAYLMPFNSHRSTSQSLTPPTSPPQVICGDLNTQANSLARLSANYCTDRMR